MGETVTLQIKPIIRHVNLKTMKVEDVIKLVLDTKLDENDIQKLRETIKTSNNIDEFFKVFSAIIKSKQEK